MRPLSIAFTTALLGVIFLSPGCATSPESGGEQGIFRTAPDLKENESVAFGRIIFIEDGVEKIPYSAMSRPPVPFFYDAGESRTVRPRWKGWGEMVSKDGAFTIALPQGTYIVTEILYGKSFIPKAAFTIPSSGKAFYLGTLVFELEKGKDASGKTIRTGTVSLTDRFEEDRALFARANPGLGDPVGKSLMVHDESLPDNPVTRTRRELLGILGIILNAPVFP